MNAQTRRQIPSPTQEYIQLCGWVVHHLITSNRHMSIRIPIHLFASHCCYHCVYLLCSFMHCGGPLIMIVTSALSTEYLFYRRPRRSSLSRAVSLLNRLLVPTRLLVLLYRFQLLSLLLLLILEQLKWPSYPCSGGQSSQLVTSELSAIEGTSSLKCAAKEQECSVECNRS